MELFDGKPINNFPALKHYGIPLVTTSIHSVLRDMVSFSKSTSLNKVLTSPLFNRADTSCSLVNVPSSTTYNRFKHHANRNGWIKQILSAASRGEDGEVAARWLMQYLGEMFSDCFAAVACSLGLLLPSKVMDAESAAAMWEEGNVPLRAQRIILSHLKSFFERCIMVPERYIKELESSSSPPISGSAEIGRSKILFWY